MTTFGYSDATLARKAAKRKMSIKDYLAYLASANRAKVDAEKA